MPVTADLENGSATGPQEVVNTIHLAIGAGLDGASIEDWDGTAFEDIATATERIAAAAAAADDQLVLTARADNHIHGVTDLADTIAQLQAFDEAGAHVLYAPGLATAADIKTVIDNVTKPVNVLLRAGGPTVPELAELGVARITVGGAFLFAAYGALVDAATELLGPGTTTYAAHSAVGLRAAADAFPPAAPR